MGRKQYPLVTAAARKKTHKECSILQRQRTKKLGPNQDDDETHRLRAHSSCIVDGGGLTGMEDETFSEKAIKAAEKLAAEGKLLIKNDGDPVSIDEYRKRHPWVERELQKTADALAEVESNRREIGEANMYFAILLHDHALIDRYLAAKGQWLAPQ